MIISPRGMTPQNKCGVSAVYLLWLEKEMNLNCGLPKSPICVSATTTSVRNSQIFDGQTTIFAGESSKIMLQKGVLLIDSSNMCWLKPSLRQLVALQPTATGFSHLIPGKTSVPDGTRCGGRGQRGFRPSPCARVKLHRMWYNNV
jgi:hypothetical protein